MVSNSTAVGVVTTLVLCGLGYHFLFGRKTHSKDKDTSLNSYVGLHADFAAASAHLSGANLGLSTEQQLKFYALFKQATHGDCTAERPGLIDQVARAKWDAWHTVEGWSKMHASTAYVEGVKMLDPDWNPAAAPIKKYSNHPPADQPTGDDGEGGGGGGGGGGMGRGVSVMSSSKDTNPEQWKTEQDIFEFARTGQVEKMRAALQGGVDVNQKDEEGQSALHYAVDREQGGVVKLLLEGGVDMEIKDEDGATPLAYAVTCEYPDMARLLVEAGASVDTEDNDGDSPASAAAGTPMEEVLAAGVAARSS